jgi:hypothetical protein
VFPTAPGNDHLKFTEGMRVKIYDASAAAYLTDGTNAYFLISAVTAADNSITVSVIVNGGWTPATGDKIEPYYPTAALPTTRIIEMRSGRVYRDTAGTSAISVTGIDFTLNDNVKYYEEEITDSGYPEDYTEGARQVDCKMDLLMRQDDLKYYGEGVAKTTHAMYIEGRDPDAPTVRTNAMQLAMPNALGSVPDISGTDELRLSVEHAALYDSAYEDELTLKFGDLTA